MAMSVVYTTIDGVLVHEDRGGVERQYVGDPLGSLVGELDENQNLTYTAEYWPYGEVRTESGSKQSEWGFVGLLGYIRDLATLLYVRARHYLPRKARWLTVDPLWPREANYGYCSCSPLFHTDYSGSQTSLNQWGSEMEQTIRGGAQNLGKKYNQFCKDSTDLISDILMSPYLFFWTHGNCCGGANMCNESDALPGGKAIDCVDRACARHDTCLKGVFEFAHPATQFLCDFFLCQEIKKCYGLFCKPWREKPQCIAARRAGRLYCWGTGQSFP